MSCYLSFTIDLEKIGYNNGTDPTIVGELVLTFDARVPDHDGYCSDPGEDVGEWEHSVERKIPLNLYTYKILRDMANENDGEMYHIPSETLQKLFADERYIPCQLGSGYCGYNGEINIQNGYIRYILHELEEKTIRLTAYYLAKKDGHKQSPEYYWYRAEKSISRRKDLQKALALAGLSYRKDSKLCELWISDDPSVSDKTIDDVVRVMAECKWCFDYHDMSKKLKEYPHKSAEIFSQTKAEILEKYPLPSPYPWIK